MTEPRIAGRQTLRRGTLRPFKFLSYYPPDPLIELPLIGSE